MARASRIMPMLSVADMAAARRFYEMVLGGSLVYQFPETGEPVFLTLRFGETELGLGVLSDKGLHRRALRPATGHRIELCINVDDVDAALEALAAPVVMAPVDQPWGERAAYVEDPDGNLVMLVSPV
ncbi:MAG: VOC family protein [Candidatus Devosia phytovorans]|uniref:VOC family protein n=1 Tax=Candidatus Devosia phytovorans TaxID=3121372 RepID=A0AAJ5VSU4_9HYPH|nr:VOC family protein [Devosia sp.]WEK04183.1 MAG: VOC family protein [Devosia sp.]